MRIARIVLMAAIVCFAIACGDPQRDTTERQLTGDSASVESTGAVHSTIRSCEGLETAILNAPPTRDDLRRIHGAPDSVDTWTEPNRHVEAAVDSLFTVHYPGFVANFRVPTSGPDLIVDASITSNRFSSDPGLSIGTGEADIVERLGEPTRRERGNLVYECGMGAEQPVTFVLRDGVVGEIRIAYYVD